MYNIMNREQLIKERVLLCNKIAEIDVKLGNSSDESVMEGIRLRVKEVTGVDVKDLGKHCTFKAKDAKKAFYRMCYLQQIKGSAMAFYVSDKTRSSPSVGRKKHIKLCKTDSSIAFEWNKIKEILKNG